MEALVAIPNRQFIQNPRLSELSMLLIWSIASRDQYETMMEANL